MTGDPMGTRSFSTPLPMVAEQSRPSTTDELRRLNELANVERRVTGKPIDKWSPRAEPTKAARWNTQLSEAMRTARPSIPQWIFDGPPSAELVLERMPNATTDERTAALTMALSEYQILNTWLWDLLESSIDIKGAYEEADAIAVDRFRVGELRDGVGLREWAMELAAVDPIAEQIEAVRKLAAFPALAASDNVTIVQLDNHANKLLSAWMKVDGNHPDINGLVFQARLLASMPTTPITSRVVVVRQHLVDAIERKDPGAATPDKLLRLITARAKALGMPAGDVRQPLAPREQAMPVIGDDGKESGPKPNKARPRAGKNDCSLCDIDICQANQWAKKAGCSVAKKCVVHAFVDVSKFKVEPKPTSAEIGATIACQETLKRNPKATIKGASIRGLRKENKEAKDGDKEAKDGDTKPTGGAREAAVPLIAIQQLLGEQATEITNAGEFATWAASMQLDLASPVIQHHDGSEQDADEHEQAPAPSSTADAVNDVAAAVTAAEAARVAEAEEQRMIIERLRQQNQLLRDRNAALPSTTWVAPSPGMYEAGNVGGAPPPATPFHLRPVNAPTPIPNSTLAGLRSQLRPVPEHTDKAEDRIVTQQKSQPALARDTQQSSARSAGELFGEAIAKMGQAVAYLEKEHRIEKQRTGWLAVPKKIGVTVMASAAKALVYMIRTAQSKLEWRDAALLSVAVYVAYPATHRAMRRFLWAVWTLAFTRIRNQISIINAGMLGMVARRMQDAARAMRSVSAVRAHATTAMSAVTAAAIADIQDQMVVPMLGDATPRVSAQAARLLVYEHELIASMPERMIPEAAELSDNGATSCIAKTTLGLIPGTEMANTSGGFAVGDNSTMEASVTNLHAYYRCGLDGARVAVLRRKHMLPSALCNIGSEGEDVKKHKQKYVFDHDGRSMFFTPPAGGSMIEVKLHMSANQLGWYWMEEIKDPAVIRELLTGAQVQPASVIAPVIVQPGGYIPEVCCLTVDDDTSITNPDTGSSETQLHLKPGATIQGMASGVAAPVNAHTGVSMSRPPKLSGYQILVRMHVVLGHASLATMLRTLARMPGTAGLITRADVEKFRERKCGICDTTLMITAPFPRKGPQPKPEPGMRWTRDAVTLRVPSHQHGYLHLTSYVDNGSDVWVILGHKDYTAETVIACDQQIRAFNRPHHGEIMQIRSDNHPSYRAKKVEDYFTDSEMSRQFSASYAHSSVGDAEVTFRVLVPRANALLRGCTTGGGEEHFPSAMFTACAARNATCTGNNEASADMKYYGWNAVQLEATLAYGAPVKFLEYPEARDSKFDDHALPGTYRGPSRDTIDMKPSLCWVLAPRQHGRNEYLSIRMGCLRIDERPVLARTTQSHPSHQPFGDATVEHTTDREPKTLDFSAWRDPTIEGYTADGDRADTPSAVLKRIVWQPSMQPPDVPYFVGVCGGDAGYEHDMPAIMHAMSRNKYAYIIIDTAFGGHGQDITEQRGLDALVALVAHHLCIGVGLSPRCAPVSALLCLPGGPGMLFNMEHPDGIPDLPEPDKRRQRDALRMYEACVTIARAHADSAGASRIIWWEGPVWRGKGSRFHIPGQDGHSSMFHIGCIKQLLSDVGATPVYFDQQSLGATSPKTTALWCTPQLLPHVDELFGTLPIAVPTGDQATVGFTPEGKSKAKALERYPPQMRIRLVTAVLRAAKSLSAQYAAGGGMAPIPPTAKVEAETVQPAAYVLPDKPSGAAEQPTQPKAVEPTADTARQLEDALDDAAKETEAPAPAAAPDKVDQPNHIEKAQDEMLKHYRQHLPAGDGKEGTYVEVTWADSDEPSYSGHIVDYRMWRGKMNRSRYPRAQVGVKYDDGVLCYHDLTGLDIKKASKAPASITDQRQLDEQAQETEFITAYGDINLVSVMASLTHERNELAMIVAELAEAKPQLMQTIFDDGSKELMRARSETVCMPEVDIETGELCQVTATLAHTGKQVVTVHPNDIDRWHLPQNEQEYNLSPHRARWRNAKELKMDAYLSVPSWHEVPEPLIPKTARKFRLKWNHALKQMPESELLKMAPRLCVVGTGMDPFEYPSYSEVAYMLSLNILGAIYATHMEEFIEEQDDDQDAFQNTIADPKEDENVTPMYTHPAPGFEKKCEEGPHKGARLFYLMRVMFQGRIDSPRVYGTRAKERLKAAGWRPLMYDREAFVYHHGPLANTAASLPEILESFKTAPPASQGEPPVGYGMCVRHVDDRVRIVTSRKITEYLRESFKTAYVMQTTSWKKVLGWETVINKEDRTVCWECPSVLIAAGKKYLQGATFANNRHVALPSLMSIEPGVAPPQDHPDYDKFMTMQAETRSMQGLMIWITQKYTQALFVTRKTGQHHHSPGWDSHRHLCFALMHLIAHPYATHYGGPECRSIEHATPIKQPITHEERIYSLYYMVDASLAEPLAFTGVVGMLAAGQIDTVCQRQHNKAGESHTVEVVAGGTAQNRAVIAQEIKREWGYPQTRPTPFMFDSATTIFVATSETASKRSLWLKRREAVLQESVDRDEIEPMKIDEADNAADMHTKYLTYPVWRKHTWLTQNLTKERCEAAKERLTKLRATINADA